MPVNQQTVQALRVRRMVTELTRERARRRRRVPAAAFPSGARLQYHRYLLGLQRQLEQAIRDIVFPNLKELSVQSQITRPDAAAERLDQNTTEFITAMVDDVKVTLGQNLDPVSIDAAAGDAGQAVANHNQRQIGRQLRSTLGIDPIAAEPWMAEQMAAFRRENVNLVTNMMTDELDKIENVLIRGQRRGLRVEVLRKDIERQFGLSRKRATLIARDQTNKINGQLTELRQTGLGIEEYIWRTSQDERVRETHMELDGTRQRWNDPPVTNPAGDRNHPGEDYQCRCFAEPVIQALEEAAAAGR